MGFNKVLKIFIIFLVIFSWIFSGWPRIWQKPPIPPEVQEAKAQTTDTYYGTCDSVNSSMANPSYAEVKDDAQYAEGEKNETVVIQSWSGTAGSGTISGVRIYCEHYATTPDGDDYTLVDYSLDNWVSMGTTTGQQVMPASETSFSVDITADMSWTWTDITNLEVRATAKASAKQGFTIDYIEVLYIQVDYTAPVPTVSCSTNISSTDFGTLSSSAITDSSSNASTTMSCSDTTSGCILYVKDAGDTSNPGLATTSPAYLIPSPDAAYSASTTLSFGTEGYGIQATTTAAGLNIALRYLLTGDDAGGLYLTNQTIASSSADISGAEVIVTHKAAISQTTPPGEYEDTITYECVIN